MLAQGSPRDILASESEARRALTMGMDFSPSQLVINPIQPLSLELQSLIEAQGQNNGASFQSLPIDQRLLLQSLITQDFANSTFAMPSSSQALPPASDFSTFPSTSSGHSIHPSEIQPSPEMSNGMASASSTGNVSTSRSSSASFESQPHAIAYSRRPGSASSGSPKSAPSDIVSFGRTNQAARQRTAQACEKCRDRKTKCSGTKPVCRRCSDRGLTCVWAPESRVRGVARQARQTRLESGDNMGKAMSSLPVPFECSSGDSSPSIHGRNLAKSAPAYQTTFPLISLPSHVIPRDQQKRQSWQGAFPLGVSRGIHAHSILGGPIRPITSVDDCWISVDDATCELPGRDRSTTVRPRERRSSVSVAHLARARSRDQLVTSSATQVAGSPESLFGNAFTFSHFNRDTPTLLTEGLPTASSIESSESEPSLSLSSLRNSPITGHDLHQPHPTYDMESLLSDEMINLLNFPTPFDMMINDQEFLDSLESFSFENSDPSKMHTSPPANPEVDQRDDAEEIFAQFFDADAFGQMRA